MSFAFKRTNGDITGWAVLLGQKRNPTRATLLSLTINGVPLDDDDLVWELVR